MGQQRVYASAQYKENINRQVLFNVDNINTEAFDLRERLNIESLDRIVSSKEEQDLGAVGNEGRSYSKYNPWISIAPASLESGGDGVTLPTTSNANGVFDTAGIDRNSEIYDTTTSSPSGELGSAETLTDGVIRDFLSDIRPNGGKDPSVFFGGHKTYSEVQGIYVKSVRISNPSDTDAVVTIGVNGINTFRGNGTGLHISKVYDIPFIPSKDIPGAPDNPNGATASGATSNIGNIYALDTSDPESAGIPRFGIRTLKPPVYYEASPRIPGFPFITGGFVERGIFESIMETYRYST